MDDTILMVVSSVVGAAAGGSGGVVGAMAVLKNKMARLDRDVTALSDRIDKLASKGEVSTLAGVIDALTDKVNANGEDIAVMRAKRNAIASSNDQGMALLKAQMKQSHDDNLRREKESRKMARGLARLDPAHERGGSGFFDAHTGERTRG